jgi:hypothetical protein
VASAEKVDMEMRNRLAAVGSVIDDETIACGGDVFAAGDFGSCEEKMTEEASIIGLGISDAGERFFRNNEDVNWSLGEMSRKARHWSSSKTISAGISRAMIFSNRVMRVGG